MAIAQNIAIETRTHTWQEGYSAAAAYCSARNIGANYRNSIAIIGIAIIRYYII